MSLDRFHPIVRAWFEGQFEGPTEAQTLGWDAVAHRRHTLIAAPTGSGKTLAAFMECIDGLVRAGLNGGLPDGTEVVYVSPLKALSNDIHRNLQEPLAEISELAAEAELPLPEIRVSVRTGDTPQSERQAMVKRPPHMLVTTPESLYLLLTSEKARNGLKGVKTLIVDELHAVAGSKRGSHLALTMERLCELAENEVTRIGISATQKPIDEMAKLLVGAGNMATDGSADCVIVDAGHAREIDLEIEVPDQFEVGPIATHEYMAETMDCIAELVRGHDTTLVFVNTRRMVERVAHLLEKRLGPEAIAAHHGSLSRKRRQETEHRLKFGEIKACVATASLELGIDIGNVDLVCQIGSPRSIAVLLQRVGRSGHSLGATPKGRLFPLTRDELFECAALCRAIRRGSLDAFIIPPWPLDVLAQQIVAACACDPWEEDKLFELCQRAYPYSELPRPKFEQIVNMLSRGVVERGGSRGAYLHRDGVNGVLRGRRSARISALTSGGAIPDNTDYDVVLDPEGVVVGAVNEDFAIESMGGDVFLLGNSSWRIKRIEMGRVRVEAAPGATPSIPFWLGEAPARTKELSGEISDLRDALAGRIDKPEAAVQWLMEDAGVPVGVAQQIVDYMVEGRRILGTVPTKNRIVAERFFDESGGTQIVIHSPLGARINRAWGMALRKQICRTFDFELQAAATDDGINFSLGPQHSFPLSDVFRYIKSPTASKVVEQAILQVPIFGARWRWNATRSLAVLRFMSGRRVPPPILRMRTDDLLALVFPAQVECQDNTMPGDIDVPDHPLVFETMRDCLTDYMDAEAFGELIASIERGEVEVLAYDTLQPSVFSHQILNANPYAFLDEAPLEERRARAVALRRALPEDSRDLGALSPEAIREATVDAWPVCRDAEELHDALLTMLLIPEEEAHAKVHETKPGNWLEWFDELASEGRAFRVMLDEDGATGWGAAETAGVVRAAYPTARLMPEPRPVADAPPAPEREDALLEIVRARAEASGPFTVGEVRKALRFTEAEVRQAIARLESEGQLLAGRFRSGVDEGEYCDRRILARIHRATISGLRREIEPVPQAAFARFLFYWQHAIPGSQAMGEQGLLEVIEQLQGFEAAASAWESDMLPARVAGYRPSLLDELCRSGEIVWGRLAGRRNGDEGIGRTGLLRTSPITLALRDDLEWLRRRADTGAPDLRGAAQEVYEFLSWRGASFLSEIIQQTRRLPSDVEEALWQLVAAGLVTADDFSALRSIAGGTKRPTRRNTRVRRRARYRSPGSRWSLFDGPRRGETADEVGEDHGRGEEADPGLGEDDVEWLARQYLRRWGVVFREMMAREPSPPGWRHLLGVYRRLEARGEIRGGRFIQGTTGEQFASPEALEALKTVRKAEPSGDLWRVSACDPLNISGILTFGQRVPAVAANQLMFRDGVVLASMESGQFVRRGDFDEPTLEAVRSAFLRRTPAG